MCLGLLLCVPFSLASEASLAKVAVNGSMLWKGGEGACETYVVCVAWSGREKKGAKGR